MSSFFNSTDLDIVPVLANYSLIISGSFTSTSYMYDFDWADYYNFNTTSTKQDFWTTTSGIAAFSKLSGMQLNVSNNGEFSSNSTLGNKFTNTDNVFVF
jgi:hypothetical protein